MAHPRWLYAKSERALKAPNQGLRRIINHMLTIAPSFADADRAAPGAWCELEDQHSAGTPSALSAVGGRGVSLRFYHQDDSP